MALIEDLPRNATITSTTDCEILQIEKKNFDMLLRINSFVALRIMTALTKRLRADTSTGKAAESKEQETKAEEHNYMKTEFNYGEFSRTIYFPEEIDTSKTEAELKDGILEIKAPKKVVESENKKKLAVK